MANAVKTVCVLVIISAQALIKNMISQVMTKVTPIVQTLRRSVPAKGINVMGKIAQLL